MNGIKLGASLDDVKEAFGEPDTEGENGWMATYRDKNTDLACVWFLFNEDGELWDITLFNMD